MYILYICALIKFQISNLNGDFMSQLDENTYPTLLSVECPECGSTEFKINGTEESTRKKVKDAKNLLFMGAMSNMVSSSDSETDFELKPIKFQCLKCKKKFNSLPDVAQNDELLEKPCLITFKRLSSLRGCAVNQQVFLNGVKVGNVSNNSEISFYTHTKSNVIFVTDHKGNAFKGVYKFTAENGGQEEIKFKNKFV